MTNRTQISQADAQLILENGGVVIYWRPGCPFCERLDSGLGILGDKAGWVNIWEDSAAEDFVKSVNNGNAVVPTVTTSERSFVAASSDAPQVVSKLIENSGK